MPDKDKRFRAVLKKTIVQTMEVNFECATEAQAWADANEEVENLYEGKFGEDEQLWEDGGVTIQITSLEEADD